jgi:Ca2+-binding EF-hand superfamily protein
VPCPTNNANVWCVLQLLDDNMDGLITFDELKSFFKKAFAETKGAVDIPSDDMIKQMLAATASEGSQVSFDDFCAILDQVAA